MWVFCCGMLRSGSTLQYQLTAGLVETLGLGTRSRYVPENQFSELLSEYKDVNGFVVLKSHLLTPAMQGLLIQGNALSIGCYRDIRDVAVSMMKKWNLTFDDLMAQRRIEGAREELEKWAHYPGHMLSKYEEMINNPTQEVLRIASHLSIGCPENNANELVADHSLDKQIKRVREVAQKKSRLNIDGDYWDDSSLLHHNHIYSGTPGAWKSVLTQKQVEVLESRFRDWFVAKGYFLS